MAEAGQARPPRVAVIGGGIAGCAAAAALAGNGLEVLLLEAGHHLGGVAVQAEHRTLCGLAPIDAPAPELLEPALVAGWLPYLANGPAHRRGRVWLWPTSAATLQAGLARRLAACAVAVNKGWWVNDVECGAAGTISALQVSAGGAPLKIAVAAVIDASGRGVSAERLGHAVAPPLQWPAHRSVLRLPPATAAQLSERAGRQTLFARIQASGAATGAIDLTPIDQAAGLWQLSLDVPPGSAMAVADASATAAAAALGAELVACACALGVRDAGRPLGALTLEQLFAGVARGLCWAAWPAEVHRQGGVDWRWPARARYGVPAAAARLPGGPANLWLIGKGMAVAPEAAAALRVTGTCLALGAAVAGEVVAALAGAPPG